MVFAVLSYEIAWRYTMKWTELIILRMTEIPDKADDRLAQIACPLSAPGLIRAILHRNASIAGDFSFALHWDTEKPQARGSDLARSLGHRLKKLGLVNHSVWVPMEHVVKSK
jgi:hypothetical protein